jgi:hypothetical protein
MEVGEAAHAVSVAVRLEQQGERRASHYHRLSLIDG